MTLEGSLAQAMYSSRPKVEGVARAMFPHFKTNPSVTAAVIRRTVPPGWIVPVAKHLMILLMKRVHLPKATSMMWVGEKKVFVPTPELKDLFKSLFPELAQEGK